MPNDTERLELFFRGNVSVSVSKPIGIGEGGSYAVLEDVGPEQSVWRSGDHANPRDAIDEALSWFAERKYKEYSSDTEFVFDDSKRNPNIDPPHGTKKQSPPMTQEDFTWSHDNPTGPAGWYAVVVCWDENQGMFPSSAFWDGQSWGDDKRPIAAFHGPHPSSEAAESWAYEHDPEM